MNLHTLTDSLIRYRWWVVTTIPLLILLIFLTGLKKFGFEADVTIWFDENSKTLKEYRNFKNRFGTDDTIIIIFKDEAGIFNKKALGSIERITEKLWETKYIGRVDSITNYQYIYDNNGDIAVIDFIEDASLIDSATLKLKKAIATTDKQTKNFTISEDGKTTAIQAKMVPLKKSDSHTYYSLREKIERIIEKERELTGYSYYLNGIPIINTEFFSIASEDAIFTPIILIASFILLMVMFRRFSGAIIPITIVILTSMLVMSIQAHLGFSFNNFTVNVPVFIIAIGIADSVHFFWVWLFARRHGKSNRDSIYESLKRNIRPAFLTSLTTFIGFMSLLPSSIVPVKTLGIATASAALIAFFLTTTMLPAMLAILNPKVTQRYGSKQSKIAPFAHRYSSFILTYDKYILTFSITLMFLAGWGLNYVNIDSEAIKYFKDGTYIRQSTNFIEKHITGPANGEVIVDSKANGGIKDPDFLKTVDRFEKELKENFPHIRNTNSLLDILKRFNQVMHDDNSSYYRVPESKQMSAQYLLLYSLSLPQGMDINDKMDVHERYFRITVSMDLLSSNETLKIIDWEKEWWSKTPYSASIQGQGTMYTYMQGDVIYTLIYSISLALLLVTLVILFAFKSVKVALLSILPNVLPVVLSVGLMGWWDINIDIGVAVAGAIIIGIAIDDTIHFLVKYLCAKKDKKSVKEALEYMIMYAGSAIIFTTVILSLAFSIFIFSDFKPNYNFGLITASALIVALVTDLLMLPSLFSYFDKRRSR